MKYRIYLDPNDSFYRDAANEWLVKLMNMIGDQNARNMVADIEGTWHEVRDAIRVLVETQPHPVNFTEPVDEAEQQAQEAASYDFLLGSATMQADLEIEHLLAPEIARRDLADNRRVFSGEDYELGTQFIVSGGETKEVTFGSKAWFDNINEIPF